VQYWEEVIAGVREHVKAADIAGKSLPLRMREAGFSTEELAVLERVISTGDELHAIEQVAFAATQGFYDPQKSDFVSDGKPNAPFALKEVYSTSYGRLQAKMRLEVSRLTTMADRRTSEAVRDA